MKMLWLDILVLFGAVTSGLSINRPVYKVVLTQKGYAEFLQYDIETRAVREFTLCTWFRIYELVGDQTIFTYIAKGNNRVIRLWLDSDGKYMKVLINNKVSSSSPVDVIKNVWRHVCLSYQSDYGAWALYMDSRLVSCHSSQRVSGFVLPGSGSIVIGYGSAINGVQNGVEGEIFGVNMILISTIAGNYTIKSNPTVEQKPFHKNKIKGGEHLPHYVVLTDLQSDEVNNNFETTNIPLSTTANKSFIKIKTPHRFIEHEVGLNSKINRAVTDSFVTNSLPEITTDKVTENNNYIWNLSTETHKGRYIIRNKNKNDLRQTPIPKELPALYEHEVPPPISESIYKVNDDTSGHNNLFHKKQSNPLSEVELPPPLNKDTKVYGQWTSSTFAGSVLNYLKNQQPHLRELKRIVTPQTIPLVKNSDNLPYASNFKVIKIRSPYQRRNVVEKQLFENKKIPQINVQVLEDDLRNNIIKSHAQTKAKNVEIYNTGLLKQRQEQRFYRNVDEQQESQENSENLLHTKILQHSKTRKKNMAADIQLRNQNLLTILPFLKSLAYFTEESSNTAAESSANADDVYTRSLSLGNKWHNVKSYNNDYTPRQINAGLDNDQTNLDEKIAEINKRHPAIRLKYKHGNRKGAEHKDDEFILKGRKLAMEISNSSDYNSDSVSLFNYNRGLLSASDDKVSDKVRGNYDIPGIISNKSLRNSFNKQVKIGNALNERPVIGNNVDQNKKSFVGGDERVPDIQKYRSNIDGDEFFSSVRGSLGIRICKKLELHDRVLYVHPDESIDMSYILSPIKRKNAGIEFIIQNYKKCSLEDTPIKNNAMLLIDWNKTPVRLFGGAYTRRTTDLCGFF